MGYVRPVNNQLLDFAGAAKEIGVTRARVSAAVKKGLIITEQYGPVRLIRKHEALRYKKESKPAGRPRRTS